MERPKRTASKVTNYRTYHLSGDLDQTLQGKVGQVVNTFEENIIPEQERDSEVEPPTPKMSDAEKLQKQLEEKRAATKKAAQEAEEMKIRNELEEESLKQQEWELAMQQLKAKREKTMAAHNRKLEEMKKLAEEVEENEGTDSTVQWLKEQLQKLSPGEKDHELEEKARKEQEAKNKMIQDIKNQQAELARKLEEITGEAEPVSNTDSTKMNQDMLLQQLQTALATKSDTDPQKAMIRALATQGNKAVGPGGVNMLRPDIMQKITHTPMGNNMSEWLANFNREDEGESFLRWGNQEGDLECKHTKLRSGMLDKSTMNIKQKQVWPQKNLGEDWAEDEMDFKQIRFEHLVAGETRTIETCNEPAQILGRLRLLRRIAYLKLRGYEWHLLRRMYAAILGSIETGEYSWESNFDRFETILYRRTQHETRPRQDRERGPDRRVWYCRDYNKEGCNKHAPHQAWFGTGSSAIKRQVIHACAACLLKERVTREHPEGHQECPHSD